MSNRFNARLFASSRDFLPLWGRIKVGFATHSIIATGQPHPNPPLKGEGVISRPGLLRGLRLLAMTMLVGLLPAIAFASSSPALCHEFSVECVLGTIVVFLQSTTARVIGLFVTMALWWVVRKKRNAFVWRATIIIIFILLYGFAAICVHL
jgi:hypothetical protein